MGTRYCGRERKEGRGIEGKTSLESVVETDVGGEGGWGEGPRVKVGGETEGVGGGFGWGGRSQGCGRKRRRRKRLRSRRSYFGRVFEALPAQLREDVLVAVVVVLGFLNAILLAFVPWGAGFASLAIFLVVGHVYEDQNCLLINF